MHAQKIYSKNAFLTNSRGTRKTCISRPPSLSSLFATHVRVYCCCGCCFHRRRCRRRCCRPRWWWERKEGSLKVSLLPKHTFHKKTKSKFRAHSSLVYFVVDKSTQLPLHLLPLPLLRLRVQPGFLRPLLRRFCPHLIV